VIGTLLLYRYVVELHGIPVSSSLKATARISRLLEAKKVHGFTEIGSARMNHGN
jgi:hypothetical protein